MDQYKKQVRKDLSWELDTSYEYGKTKIRGCTKKLLRKTSRKRLKNKLKKDENL